jgi:hypothetical protein
MVKRRTTRAAATGVQRLRGDCAVARSGSTFALVMLAEDPMEPRTAQPREVRTARSIRAARQDETSARDACSGSSASAIAEIAAMPIGFSARGSEATS